MHALVAGATGFVGGALVRRLLDDGVQVRALVRDSARTGVARVIYLGGLGDEPGSEHLRSESSRTLRHLVARLPVMIAPRWLSTPTQPIDIDDVVAYLAAAPAVAASAGREIQIGSPDVLPYGEMLVATTGWVRSPPVPRRGGDAWPQIPVVGPWRPRPRVAA